MKRVRFDGNGRLAVFGRELASGETATFSDEQAAELVAHPRIKVTVLGVTVTTADGVHYGDISVGRGDQETGMAATTSTTTKKRRTTTKEK